jgi:hypothetical protein
MPALREFRDHFAANLTDREGSLRAQPIPLDDLRDTSLEATAERPVRV